MALSSQLKHPVDAPRALHEGMVGCIPVRNIWLLMLYASELYQDMGKDRNALEESPEDIPNLIAEMLCHHVEKRIVRNLSSGYRSRNAVLNRVRGRIDLLTTERRRLLERGQVACEFTELTIDTARNRYVLAALMVVSRVVTTNKLAGRCRSLAARMRNMGVGTECPNRRDLRRERLSRHDSQDRMMLSVAHLAFELELPSETAGSHHLSSPNRDIVKFRALFEKAVGGFYNVVLSEQGWKVRTGRVLRWAVDEKTNRIDDILPSMQTDIELDNPELSQRTVIDTKFNSLLVGGYYREKTIRSGYIYQMYAYLRSQEGQGSPLTDKATGLLLHPSIDEEVFESVTIQGHRICFATVNLNASAKDMRAQLIAAVT